MTAGSVAAAVLLLLLTANTSPAALARPTTSAASDAGLFPADVREAGLFPEGDAASARSGAGAAYAAAAADKVLHLPGWGKPDVGLFSG